MNYLHMWHMKTNCLIYVLMDYQVYKEIFKNVIKNIVDLNLLN